MFHDRIERDEYYTRGMMKKKSGEMSDSRRLVFSYILIILSVVSCAPIASGAISVSYFSVTPPVENLTGGLDRVNVTFNINLIPQGGVTFEGTNTLELSTDLEDAIWHTRLIRDGNVCQDALTEGKIKDISGWELSYPSTKTSIGIQVSLDGTAPRVGANGTRFLARVRELGNGQTLPGSDINVSRMILYNPVPPTPVVTTRQGGPTGTITLLSDPRNASVYLNGFPNGTTPVVLSGLPGGPAAITLTKEGYADCRINVSVVPYQNQTLTAVLSLSGMMDSQNGTIMLTSDPSGAEVVFDGHAYGATPLDLTVSPGPHPVTLNREGYKTYSGTANVEGGLFTRFHIVLPPAETQTVTSEALPSAGESGETGSIVISSRPTGAIVSLNSREVGTTPYIGEVPEGVYQVNISMAGYESYSKGLLVVAGETASLSPNMTSKGLSIPGVDTISGLINGAVSAVGHFFDGLFS